MLDLHLDSGLMLDLHVDCEAQERKELLGVAARASLRICYSSEACTRQSKLLVVAQQCSCLRLLKCDFD